MHGRMQHITLNITVCINSNLLSHLLHHEISFTIKNFYFDKTEADELLADNSIGGHTDIKSHEALLGNIGPFAAGSMRKSIILSNGTSNVVHEVNSAAGIVNDCIFFEFNLRF